MSHSRLTRPRLWTIKNNGSIILAPDVIDKICVLEKRRSIIFFNNEQYNVTDRNNTGNNENFRVENIN